MPKGRVAFFSFASIATHCNYLAADNSSPTTHRSKNQPIPALKTNVNTIVLTFVSHSPSALAF